MTRDRELVPMPTSAQRGMTPGEPHLPRQFSTLGDLCVEFERRAAEAEREGVERDSSKALVAAAYRIVLEELRPLVTAGSDASRSAPAPDRLLTAEQVAEILLVPVRYVYDHAARWPFTRRLSRKALRFSEAALHRWVESRR